MGVSFDWYLVDQSRGRQPQLPQQERQHLKTRASRGGAASPRLPPRRSAATAPQALEHGQGTFFPEHQEERAMCRVGRAALRRPRRSAGEQLGIGVYPTGGGGLRATQDGGAASRAAVSARATAIQAAAGISQADRPEPGRERLGLQPRGSASRTAGRGLAAGPPPRQLQIVAASGPWKGSTAPGDFRHGFRRTLRGRLHMETAGSEASRRLAWPPRPDRGGPVRERSACRPGSPARAAGPARERDSRAARSSRWPLRAASRVSVWRGPAVVPADGTGGFRR